MLPGRGKLPFDRIFVTHGASGALAAILSRFTHPGTDTANMDNRANLLSRLSHIPGRCGSASICAECPKTRKGLTFLHLRHHIMKVENEPCREDLSSRSAQKSKIFKHVIYGVPTFSNPSARGDVSAAKKAAGRTSPAIRCLDYHGRCVLTFYDGLRTKPARLSRASTATAPIG